MVASKSPRCCAVRRRRGWVRPVLIAAEGRHYAPAGTMPGDPGRYRIERYTLTAKVVVPKGSLIPRRAGPVEVRRLDITEGAPRAAEDKAS